MNIVDLNEFREKKEKRELSKYVGLIREEYLEHTKTIRELGLKVESYRYGYEHQNIQLSNGVTGDVMLRFTKNGEDVVFLALQEVLDVINGDY